MSGRADSIAIVEWFADMTVDPPEVDGYDALDWLNGIAAKAAVYDQPLNSRHVFRFTGRQLAALLRGES